MSAHGSCGPDETPCPACGRAVTVRPAEYDGAGVVWHCECGECGDLRLQPYTLAEFVSAARPGGPLREPPHGRYGYRYAEGWCRAVIAEARRQGAAEERARVVRWAREEGYPQVADEIERVGRGGS